jgi:hypothetical protein
MAGFNLPDNVSYQDIDEAFDDEWPDEDYYDEDSGFPEDDDESDEA